jgi:Holliday junction DNA helicase RuvA
MIAQLTGKFIHKSLPWIVLETTAGVGYEVQIPMTTAYKLPPLGQSMTLFTHLVVREDAHELCGFSSRSDRDLFRILLKANGIGPKSALGILSGMDGETFKRSVLSEDISLLTSIPGIGKKTAERLVIDLKDKLLKWESGGGLDEGSDPFKVASLGADGALQEAISALQALGYKESEVRAVLKKCQFNANSSDKGQADNTESIIRQVLKYMVS